MATLLRTHFFCDTCNHQREGFQIPDGRLICCGCSPQAVVDRWQREWDELEAERLKEENRLKKEEERRQRDAEAEEQRKIDRIAAAERAAIDKERGIAEARRRRDEARRQAEWDAKAAEAQRLREELEERRQRRMPLYKRVAHLNTRWIPFTELSLILSAIGYLIYWLKGPYFWIWSNAPTGDHWQTLVWPIVFNILLSIATLLPLAATAGLYQVCRLTRHLVEALQTPVEGDDD